MAIHQFKSKPGITLHLTPNEKLNSIYKLIDEAIDVGAKLIRFDVFWQDIEPTEGILCQTNLNRYKRAVEYIVQRGVKPIVIIGTGYPKWLLDMVRKHRSIEYILFNKAYEYAYTVARFLKPYVDIYQLGNELNHPLDPLPSRLKIVFLKAINKGLTDASNDSTRVMNIIVDVFGWKNFLQRVLVEAKDSIDIIGVDHYPKTWSLTPYEDWRILKSIHNAVKRYGKTIAITETGFATELRVLNKIVLKRDLEQAIFIDVVSKAIMHMLHDIPLQFIIWYMLWDEDPVSCEPTGGLGWCGWGILRSDFTKKPGYFVLRKWFIKLNLD